MKLPTLLQSLRPDEHRDFEKFLQSPFFKASDQYLKYFRFLCRRYPGFELEKTDLEAAYRSCFGAQSLTDSRLYNLLSGLGRQLEQYLVVRMVVEPDEAGRCALHDQLLVKALGQRNMGAYFRAEAQRLIDATTAAPAMEADDYLALQQLHFEVYFNPDTPKIGDHASHLEPAAQHLDRYYCLQKLRYAAEMKNRERIYSVRYELPLLEAVLQHSAAPGMAETNPVWSIYRHLVHLHLQGLSEAPFRDLMEVFTAGFPLLPKTDKSLLLPHLINCGIGLINQDSKVEAELFSLYKLAIETGLLLNGNRITYQTFMNISNLATICRNYEWVEGFISRFTPYLEESRRDHVAGLAWAGLYYSQGRLDEAQRCLTAEIFSISGLDLLARIQLIKIVFSRYTRSGTDYEFLLAQLKAFEKFVGNRNLTPEKEEAYLNWIRFVRKMAVVKFEMVDVPAATREALQKKLKKLQPFLQKKWVEGMIEVL